MCNKVANELVPLPVVLTNDMITSSTAQGGGESFRIGNL